jgi:hypothetical protein
MRVLLVSVVLFATAGVAKANGAFYDGNQLYESCRQNRSVCMAYTIGVIDADTMLAELNHRRSIICLPQNAVSGQLADIVYEYLQQHPETRQYTASSEVYTALAKAFPCGSGN